jgi:hypothetical protein
VQIGGIAFDKKGISAVTTKVRAGSAYKIQITIQARAANLNATSRLLIRLITKASSGGTLSQVVSVPGYGVNSKGQIIQTTQLVGIFTPKVDSEVLNVSVSELRKKKLKGLTGIIELTKVKLQLIGSDLVPTSADVTTMTSLKMS